MSASVSVVYRRSGGWSGADGQLDELEARQRHADALAADVQLVHRPLHRRGQPLQHAARRLGADVVQHHVLGLQRLELLLQRFGGLAGDEDFPLRIADAAPDLLLRPGTSAVGSRMTCVAMLVCWRVASQACSSSNSGPGCAEASKLDIW